MNLFTTTFLTLGLLTFAACANKPQKIAETLEEKQVNDILYEAPVTPTLYKTLTFKNYSFDIKTTGEGSISQLIIEPKGLEIDNESRMHELNGQVENAFIADLNTDGFPEILVFTVSAGSGSYGEVIAYSVNNGKSMSQVYFPELSTKAREGHMGHDLFFIEKNTLVQKFPIYKENDTNSEPTGGTRKIYYKIYDGEASRSFVMNRISDSK